MLLLKAPLLFPATCAAIFPMLWGRELKLWWRWSLAKWLGIGLIPGASWHLFHALNRGVDALWLWGGDGAVRVLFKAGEGSDLGWKVPVLEILEGGWPWLLLWPIGIAWAWHEKNNQWGKWVLGTQAIWALAILPLKTQLPWYSHPLWLPMALTCGVPLAALIDKKYPPRSILKRLIENTPIVWQILGITLIIAGLMGSLGGVSILKPYLKIIFSAGIGWFLGGVLIRCRTKGLRIKGTICMMGGSFLALTFLMGSSFWLWEINENWPVKPVAQLISKTLPSEKVAIYGSEERPSLNWYSKKQIKPLKDSSNTQWIITKDRMKLMEQQPSQKCQVIHTKDEWELMSCK